MRWLRLVPSLKSDGSFSASAMERNMYQIETKVRYSECGEDGKLKLASLINHFQDASSEQSEMLGLGVSYLKEKRRAWILGSWQIVVHRMPKAHEEIVVETWSTGIRGMLGPRNFRMKKKDGELLAYADTLWVYMDVDKQRPAKAEQMEIDAYGEESALEMPCKERKIKLSENVDKVLRMPVRRYHIDTNGHVNNGQYVQMAMEAVDAGFCISQVRVEYKQSAVYGDTIIVKKTEESNRILLVLCNESEEVYAVMELTGEKL